MKQRAPTLLRHALRTAAAATVVVAALYVAVCIAVNVEASRHLTGSTDMRLDTAIETFLRGPGGPGEVFPLETPENRVLPTTVDVHDVPVFVWVVSSQGATVAASENAPQLPARHWSFEKPETVALGGRDFLVEAESAHGNRDSAAGPGGVSPISSYPPGYAVVAGSSLSTLGHTNAALTTSELVIAPFLLLAVLVGSVIIGARTAAPVEELRRRQLDFTADASHELRTPVSIIEAEVQLALRTTRGADEYRGALERVSDETTRLRGIVDDLLWLSRFDAMPQPPGPEPVDMAVLVRACTERFAAVAADLDVAIEFGAAETDDAAVYISPEWADKLIGILLDNACGHAGAGGTVAVNVATSRDSVRLEVGDSGPGLSDEEVARVFERFHRATNVRSGTGLGLAIADAVVRSSRGRWDVGRSGSGGASFAVVWPRHRLAG